MPRFIYKALGAGGQLLTGKITADSEQAAMQRLRASGTVPLQVGLSSPAAKPALRPALIRRRKPNDRDLMLFTRELGILLSAGVELDRALAKLDGLVAHGPMHGLAGEILRSVKGGSSLGDALHARRDVFPAFYVGMVRAGEAGGALAPVLDRLAAMLEKSEALKARIRSALTYPMLVLFLTGLSLIVLLVYVVPEFRPMFEDASLELPFSTRIVLAASDVATEWGWLVLAGLLAALLGLRVSRSSEAGRLRADGIVLRLPLIGDLVRRIETARFCRSLGTLRANGIALIDAVGIAAGTLSNRVIADAAGRIARPLAKGEGLAAPMRNLGHFPDMAVHLVEIGEESGRLHEMLLQVADVYDTEVERSIERLLALLSPLVTIVLGCIIAFIIGSILGAILSSYEIAM